MLFKTKQTTKENHTLYQMSLVLQWTKKSGSMSGAPQWRRGSDANTASLRHTVPLSAESQLTALVFLHVLAQWHCDELLLHITLVMKVTVVLETMEPEPVSMLRTLRLKIVTLTYFGFDLDILGRRYLSPINLVIYSYPYHLDITAKQIH